MAMPDANSQRVRIHYEVDGAGVPLVLLHGLSASREWWHELGYAQALKGTHQLILIDARGHGASDKPHTPDAYALASDVADVVAVLDDLGVAKAHFLGYSMGGRIGFGIAKFAPERFHSLILGGDDADEGDPAKPNPEREAMVEGLKTGLDGWAAALEPMLGPWMTPVLKRQLLANDAQALIARMVRRDLWLRKPVGLLGALPAMTLPCLVFAGTDDSQYLGAKRAAEGMPNATFVSLPDLDHLTALCRVDLVMPHILRFLAEVC
jgi:pimeloyl-ACP methyl ester carboxylesterase